ncbi:MAG: hypothetical protein LBJ67_07180, partial [Planctomycetaceae bacterium]|nr:hypothetical protein [Planctomycetaceae bacterium]
MTIAVLVSLTVKQISSNLPHLTGAETECLLGRFISGSPPNLQWLIGHVPAKTARLCVSEKGTVVVNSVCHFLYYVFFQNIRFLF